MNRVRQDLEIASRVGQIRAPNRAGEQGVTHEEVIRGAIDPKQKVDAAEGVAGRVETPKVRLPTWTVSP